MPEQVGKIIQNGDFAWVIRNCNLLTIWEKVIDERARKHTEPISIRNRVLNVSTSTSTWAYELSFLKHRSLPSLTSMPARKQFTI